MKENDVVAIAQLLGRSKEEISTALENGGVESFVEQFSASQVVMPKPDFDKFKANYKQQVIDDLVSNKHDMPQVVYEYVKGSVLERKEKDLAKTFKVTDYSGFNDLIEKIVEQSKQRPDDDEIKRLKTRITDVEKEKEKAITELSEKFDKRLISKELTALANEIGIDAEGEALDIQKEVLLTMFQKRHGLKVDNDRIIPLDDKGLPITDSKLDPRPLTDVFREFAPKIVKLKSPEGGRGDSSTNSKGREIDFSKYCADNKIEINSIQQVAAMKDLESKGYKLI